MHDIYVQAFVLFTTLFVALAVNFISTFALRHISNSAIGRALLPLNHNVRIQDASVNIHHDSVVSNGLSIDRLLDPRRSIGSQVRLAHSCH